MTNSEIMKAGLLDIIFENRNKEYGAYALRKDYDKRLLIALGAGLALIALFIAFTMIGKKESAVAVTKDKPSMVIKEYVLPPDKPKEPEKPKEQPKPKEVVKVKPQTPVVPKIAEVKFTTPVIKEVVKEPMPPVENMEGKLISDKNKVGEPDKGKVVIVAPKEPPVTGGTGISSGPSQPQSEFTIQEREPEFPGGQEALRKFLARYLTTPGELGAGDKKVVRIKFKVEKDGSVNTFEIITSGGNEYDNEVVRVAKKMPKWIPGIQNGINVPVSYVLPVTFIGLEE